MLARHQPKRLVDVGAKLVGVARLAGVVACGLNTALQAAGSRMLEAADVVALPAMERHAHGIEGLKGRFGVHTERRVEAWALGAEKQMELGLRGPLQERI